MSDYSWLDDFFGSSGDISGGYYDQPYGGEAEDEWYNFAAPTEAAAPQNPYSLANWGITDSNQYTPNESSPWYSGIGKAAGSVLTSPDVWKYGGLLGSILAATQGGDKEQKTVIGPTSTTQNTTPTLLPAAQAGVNEILGSALPFAQANLLNPMTQEEQELYSYLFGGEGGQLSQMLNMGTESREALSAGLNELDLNNLIEMVAPQITEATMKQFGPYAATKGNAQLATTQALSDKAAEFAQKRATYQQQAATQIPQISAAQTALLSELLNMANTPKIREQTSYNTYMDTIRALLGLPAGSAGAGTQSGGTSTTTTGTDIWAKLAPIFQGMSTTGTPMAASSANTTGLAALLKALGE